MSSNALLWPSQGTKPEERLDKHKWLRLPSQGISPGVILPAEDTELVEEVAGVFDDLIHDDGAGGFVLVEET